MWLIADYLPTTFFSLRMSNATNAAAKTLLVPSPYCIKMALLDASFHRDGIKATERRFERIRDLATCIAAPEAAVVNNCFVKILKGDSGRFVSTFALREYVAYEGLLRVALGISGLPAEECDTLSSLLPHINQLGKRGCFVQLVSPPVIHTGDLDSSFAVLMSSGFNIMEAAVLQPLDDMQPSATLEQVSTFSGVAARRNDIRQSVPSLVPYQRRQTSKAFTVYERA